MKPCIRSTLHGVPSHEVQHLHDVGNVHICKLKHFAALFWDTLSTLKLISLHENQILCLHFPIGTGLKFCKSNQGCQDIRKSP